MPFAQAAARGAVVAILGHVENPGADELAVKVHLAGAVGRGALRVQRVKEWIHALSSFFFIASMPCCIIAPIGLASSCGSRSAIHTRRQPPLFGKIWIAPL